MAFPNENSKFKKGNKSAQGRPKKLLSSINEQLQSEGYEKVTPSQIQDTYSLMLNLTEAQLITYIADTQSPMLLRIMGKAMLDKKRGPDILEMMLSRAHGKPTNTTKLEHSGKVSLPPWLGGIDEEENEKP